MIQNFKKRIISGFLILLLASTALFACGAPSGTVSSTSMQKEQRDFDAFTQKLFVQEMQKNTINLHYTLANPADFGIKSHKISLGSFSANQEKNAVAFIENLSAALSEFDYEALTTKQKLAFDIMDDYCQNQLTAARFPYYKEPLRPTTGIQSELPVLLAEYTFYNPCDVTDYLSLITCASDYFREIIAFERQKSKEGLFMPAYAAKTVKIACETFTSDPEQNYLIDTFNTRIDAVSGISEQKKEIYKKQNQSLIQNLFIPAYEELANTLEELKATGTNNAGLCYYPQGKAYYEHLVRTSTGSGKSVKELQDMTEKKRRLDMDSLHTLLTANPDLLHAPEPKLSFQKPEEMLNHLLKAMQEDFYPASNASYEVNYIPKSLEGTLAPAFYLTAPIDDISRNVIYLNKSSNYSGIQLFTTLAHEGFPGHLYQTTGSYQAGLTPVRALFNYPGYVEGWATYVEMLSYRYAGLPEAAADMLMYNQSALLSLYASIDMGIHYDGWSLSDTAAFLNEYGITDGKTIRGIYELVVEEPAHYLKYYIGYLEFLELKTYAKKLLAEEYSDRAFHQAIIRIGPSPFPLLKKYLRDFYSPE